MIRQCAWCNKNMGEVEPLEDKRTTHGICPECYETIMQPQLEKAREEKDDNLHPTART